MLAWLTDMLVYRTNQIPPESYQAFVGLLGGGWDQSLSPREQARAVEATLTALKEEYRAITTADYERLATGTFPSTPEAEGLPAIVRLECLGQRDVTADPTAEADGHVSLVVAADTGNAADPWQAPPSTLTDALARFFEPRRLITTKVHVTGPSYVSVTITAVLYLQGDASSRDVIPTARAALAAYYHPWTGGPDGKGWPFGRNVYVSEIVTLLAGVSGVAFASDVVLGWGDSDQQNRGIPGVAPAASGELARRAAGEAPGEDATSEGAIPDIPIVALKLYPHELVDLRPSQVHLRVEVLSGQVGQPGTLWSEPV